MAMSNSQEAFNKGATWIDSTVTGMGRGPGNLQTEYSLIEFKQSDKNTNYFSPKLPARFPLYVAP